MNYNLQSLTPYPLLLTPYPLLVLYAEFGNDDFLRKSLGHFSSAEYQ